MVETPKIQQNEIIKHMKNSRMKNELLEVKKYNFSILLLDALK
jgi:hypothetical protein